MQVRGDQTRDMSDTSDQTPLSRAAKSGDHEAVAQQLADPSLTIDDAAFADALLLAANEGHTKVIAQLLAANPTCIDAVDSDGRTALHIAVYEARHAVTKQLLAAKPELIKVLDENLYSAFTEAVCSCGHRSAEELLALGITPQRVGIFGRSIYRGECCHEIVTLLYNLYPEAATLEDGRTQTPFLCAVVCKNEFAIELLQWKLSFDDIVAACTHELARDDPPNYIERYQPIMETQCEALFPLLGDDIVGIVFECLGLARKSKKESTNKRQRV